MLAIYVGWPMNEQLPNVARANQPYLFTLASTTYKSSAGGSISYGASNMPLWLSFDSSSRTFLGTPSDDDVSNFTITLDGSDSADSSSISRNYLMLVSSSTGLALSAADVMFVSIAQYGRTNGADGLVVRQGQTFSLQFSADVFKLNLGAEMPIVAYYGRSQDRTSLPNWINFDADSLTFSGTVPDVTSDIAPSVDYGFSFIASDYAGYAGAEGTFQLIVGAHQLSTSQNESLKINGTYNSDFDYSVPILSSVYLDDALITRDNISSVEAEDLPSYVSFNADDFTLSGTFPNISSYENFTIQVEDVYGNTVQLPYSFESIGSVFTIDTLPDVNATRGEFFSYQLLKSDFTDFNDTDITVSFESNSSWLSYHSDNISIIGMAPKKLSLVSVNVNAASSFDEETRSFKIVGIDAALTLSSSTASSSASATSAATGVSTASASASATLSSTAAVLKQHLSDALRKKLAIGLGVGIPLLAIIVAALLIFFCFARKRRNTDAEKSEEEPEINGPGFGVTHNIDDHNETAQQLSALNALKVAGDADSMLSCVTHVESMGSSGYYDALEKPMKSWRAGDNSDASDIKAQFLREQKHASLFSLETVNTSNLFSMRLVDENLKRESDFDSSRDLFETYSANFQRLDSDGNIVDTTQEHNSSPVKKPSLATVSLGDIREEHSQSGDSFYNTTNESSSYNLMAKFLNGSSPNSRNDSENQSEYFNDDFQVVEDSVGNIEWRESRDALVSPYSETHFLDLEDTPKNDNVLTSNDAHAENQSRSSIFSDLSETYTQVKGRKEVKAKLVNFTRKASLKESARQLNQEHSGETAQIHDEYSD